MPVRKFILTWINQNRRNFILPLVTRCKSGGGRKVNEKTMSINFDFAIKPQFINVFTYGWPCIYIPRDSLLRLHMISRYKSEQDTISLLDVYGG